MAITFNFASEMCPKKGSTKAEQTEIEWDTPASAQH